MLESSRSLVQKVVLYASLAGASFPALGCNSHEKTTPDSAAATAKAEDKRASVEREASKVASTATSVVHEQAFIFTLKMYKDQWTLSPGKLIGNEIKAQYRDVIVGEKEYNQHNVGDKLSSKSDVAGFFLKGSIADYVVKVDKKRSTDSFCYTTGNGEIHELSTEGFARGLEKLKESGKFVYRAHSSGRDTYTIRDRAIVASDITSFSAVNRYYAEVEIANSSLSLSLAKHLTNASTKHRITFEIPQKVFEDSGKVFNTKMSSSAIWNGRLSELSGTITKKWTERDESCYRLKLTDGSEVVVAADQMPKK